MKMRTMIILLILFLIAPCGFVLYAGTVGKISGKVTDEATGEPLISTNVVIQGTSLGAATDIDGNYTILGVPPGVYTLVVSMVGY